MIGYGFTKRLDQPLERVRERVTEALKEQGFGILMDIPLHEKLKEKLGVDWARTHILGACSPKDAYQALQVEPDIGLLLPCNVLLYEQDGGTVLSVIRPTVAMGMVDSPPLRHLAREVEVRLQRAFEAVG